MAKVRTFNGARSTLVRPLGLAPRGKEETPGELNDAEQEAVQSTQVEEVQLESLAIAGAPPEVADEAGTAVEVTEEVFDTVETVPGTGDSAPVEIEGERLTDEEIEELENSGIELPELEVPADLGEMTKAELKKLAETLGVSPEGRIDHLRNRVSQAIKEG